MTRGLVTLLAAVAALAAAGGAWAKDGKPTTARRDATTILVKFADPTAADSIVGALGDRPVGKVGKVVIVKLHAGRTVDERLTAYRARRDVVYAEPNYIAGIDVATPNDPSYSAQWGMTAISAVGGWSIFPGSYTSSGGSAIAIVDTGVDASHPDLTAHVQTSQGASCVNGVCTAGGSADNNGHGTHVAGIAAAVTNNSVGVAGVAVSSSIIPVKVLDASGSGDYAGVANGILWGASHGARVINLSLGGPDYSATLCNAVSTAISSGALVVAAAGNSGSNVPSYPAACQGAVGVAATDSTGGSPNWSNWDSPNVFISAPGDAIYSTMWSGTSISASCTGAAYCSLSGTSMASPHVAGLAALLFSQVPTRTPASVKVILATTADRIGATRYGGLTYGADPYGTCTGCTWHPYYGYGQINAQAALAFSPAAPQLTSLSSLTGVTGSTVILTGTSFSNASAVSLGFAPASFTVDSPTEITATVPAGVAYGYWRVTTPSGTAKGTLIYSIPLANITGLSALNGPSGTTVTITGTGFMNVIGVSVGDVAAMSFGVISPTAITAVVPSGLDYGRWRVTTPNGTAIASIVYTVGYAARGLTFTPATGATGSTVTLTGKNVGNASAVSLGNVPASFTVNSPTQITATVPAGVAYGYWRVTTSSGTAKSGLIYSIPLPNVTGLSGLAGVPGTSVTITGTGFSNVNGVSLGSTAASYSVISPTTIEATVPSGVPYGRWQVNTGVGSATSDVVYAVTG